MEDLHLWHLSKLSSDLVELVYASKYHLVMPCTNYTPVRSQVQIQRTEQSKLKERDPFPAFTELTVKTARSLVADSKEQLGLKQVRLCAAAAMSTLIWLTLRPCY